MASRLVSYGCQARAAAVGIQALPIQQPHAVRAHLIEAYYIIDLIYSLDLVLT